MLILLSQVDVLYFDDHVHKQAAMYVDKQL